MLSGLAFSGCGFRPDVAQTQDAPAASPPREASVESAKKQFNVTYRLDGQVLSVEAVAEGETPAAVPAMWEDRGIVSWTNANGTPTDVWSAHIAADTTFDAVLGPELHTEGGYFAAEQDGLFHPLNTFTRSDAARSVYALLKVKPTGETFLKDVTTRARCWDAATTLVTNGYMSLDENGRFFPDIAITKADLVSLLEKLFSPGAVEQTMQDVPDELTRGQAAVVFNRLLGLIEREDMPYFPDVSPQMEVYQAVECAGIEGNISWIEGDRAEPGFVNLEGYLYCVGDDGYFLRDAMVGTLYFDITGQFTSGDEALDKYVADIIDGQVTRSASREAMLREAYNYIRDRFLYLNKRNYYAIGETGWEVPEALLLFQSGKGNCYNFNGGFWALARGLGFDAVCYSGLVGVHRDPHCWVEIEFDGVPYIFDPETEMSQRLVYDYTSLFKLTYEQGAFWSYAREPYTD